MALQGDLKSFALPDVLRLLAGTGKSGLLQVAGPSAHGELSLRTGSILHGSVSTAPRADGPADVVFELLRLEEGSFAFAEGDQSDDGPGMEVDFALSRAEGLLSEWREVESVVPSMDAWISLTADGISHDVALDADGWKTVVAIAGGGNVRDLAGARALSDLDACRCVKALADAGLVEVRASHAAVTSSEDPYQAFEPFEPFDRIGPMDEDVDVDGPAPMTELEDLVVEDRPVVMEDRDDALLPEPLPGEGVAYEGEDIVGSVDGRTFDVDHDLLSAVDHAAPDDLRSLAPAPDGHGFGGELEEVGGADPFGQREADAFASEISADPMAAHAPDEHAEPIDDERGSLLKFLSSVKP